MIKNVSLSKYMFFSPRGPVWNFEGGVMRSFLLIVAVYTFWRHLGKFQQITNLGTSRSTFWAGDVLGSFLLVPKKMVLRGKYFLMRMQGNPPHPNELYGP